MNIAPNSVNAASRETGQAATAGNVGVTVIKEQAGLHFLRDVWDNLASRFRMPVLEFDWQSACAEAFYPPGQLAVYVLTSGKEIKAIAPLAVSQRCGIRQLELLGSSMLGEPDGLLYSDESALRKLLESILSTRTSLRVLR